MGEHKMNIVPISNWMITTANIQSKEVYNKLYVGQRFQPSFMPIQQVLAVGPRVEDIQVGDWVQIDMNRYYKTKMVNSSIKAGVGGGKVEKTELEPPVFNQAGDTSTYFKISDREVEGVIVDYDALPDEMKGVITIEEFLATQELERLEEEKLKKEADLKAIQAKKEKKSYSKAPAIVDSTKKNVRT